MDLIDKIIITKTKRLTISINEEAKAVLKTPRGVNREVLEKFVEKNKNWIIKNKEKKQKQLNNYKKYTTYNILPLYGEDIKIKFDKNIKIINRINGEIIFPEKYNKELLKHLKKYLKELLYEIISHRLVLFENLTKIKCNKFSISSARAKWGSCNSKNELKFNYRLIMLKPELIDYVILHELCHIREFNHSKQFWQLVEQFDVNYKQHREQLKNSSILMTIYR